MWSHIQASLGDAAHPGPERAMTKHVTQTNAMQSLLLQGCNATHLQVYIAVRRPCPEILTKTGLRNQHNERCRGRTTRQQSL
jgi:hypothetical protein